MVRRQPHLSHPTPVGILGTFSSDPEVIGVYPELSSTILPHAQEIHCRRGDDLDIGFQIQNDKDPPDPVTIDDAVVRFAAKQGYGETERDGLKVGNEGALIVLRSSDPAQVELTGNGRGILHLTRESTFDFPLVPAVWDLEITKPGSVIELPADAELTTLANYDILTARAFVWPTTIRPGDILTLQGRKVLVIKLISPVHLQVDWSDWSGGIQPAGSFSLTRGKTKSVATGPFIIEGDVVL